MLRPFERGYRMDDRRMSFSGTIQFLAVVVVITFKSYYKAFPRPLLRNTGAIYLNETRLYLKYAKISSIPPEHA